MPVSVAGSPSLVLTETLNPALFALLVDATDLFGLNHIVNLGDQAGAGSDTEQISRISWADPMAAVAEGAAVAETVPTSSDVTVAVARQALRRDITDLMQIVGTLVNVETLAMDMRNAAILRRTDMLCGLFSTLSNQVGGGAGTDFRVDDFYDAMFQLTQSRVGGPIAAVLGANSITEFQSDLRTEGGPTQFIASTQEMLSVKGPSFAGSFAGVDVYSSDSCESVAGTRRSAMFGVGCFGYKEASAQSVVALDASVSSTIPGGSPIWVEIERDSASGLTQIVGNYYLGVVELEDARGVLISTDA